MIARALLLVGCAGLLCAPAAAIAQGDKTTICHRTGGSPSASGLFRGQIIEVSTEAVSKHIPQHGDVVIPAMLVSRFGGSRSCQTNAAGALFDAQGNPVQPTAPTNPGSGPRGPG